MVSGVEVGPAAYGAQKNALMDQSMNKELILSVFNKLVAAERAGLLSEIEHYLDFSLSKVQAAGRVAPATKIAN
jgi:hypothetical protein